MLRPNIKKMNIKLFLNNLNKYADCYSPTKLFAKINDIAKTAGVNIIYGVLILYHATFDKSLPVKDRLMVVAALGYFILPTDLIPDMLPGGFVDDATALTYVIRHIWKNLSNETIRKAKQQLKEWFRDVDTDKLVIG